MAIFTSFEFEGKEYHIEFGDGTIHPDCRTAIEDKLIGSSTYRDLPDQGADFKNWLQPIAFVNESGMDADEIINERKMHPILATSFPSMDVGKNLDTHLVFLLPQLDINGRAVANPRLIGEYNENSNKFIPYSEKEASETWKMYLDNLEGEIERGEGLEINKVFLEAIRFNLEKQIPSIETK